MGVGVESPKPEAGVELRGDPGYYQGYIRALDEFQPYQHKEDVRCSR